MTQENRNQYGRNNRKQCNIFNYQVRRHYGETSQTPYAHSCSCCYLVVRKSRRLLSGKLFSTEDTAVLLRDNIYQVNVVSPFVLGIIKPKIYLPFNLSEQDMKHVITHNKHI